MKNIAESLVNETTSIVDVLKKIDLTGNGLAIVVGTDNLLLGTITDGDIRRFIISGGELGSTIVNIYNKTPKYVFIDQDHEQKKQIFYDDLICALPVVNVAMQVVDVILWHEIDDDAHKANQEVINKSLSDFTVVIMAGGSGSRLYPYTKILPKPLIPIGDKPISERIIDKFVRFGCGNFVFSVNYKAAMVKAYYAEINKEYNVSYIEENEPLGTAGSLHLLEHLVNSTFFVVNCDILIEYDYYKVYDYHKEMGNKITLVGAVKDYQIPYGVVEISKTNNLVDKIIEKPTYNFVVNTGMYILEPEVLKHIPKGKFYHITHLIEDLIKNGEKVGVYPVHGDSWLDMGQFEEMKDMMHKLGVD